MNLDNYVCEGQMSIFDLDIWSGKTCPEPSVQTKEKISEPCLKKRQKSQIKMPLYLDLRGGQSGHHQDVSWEMGGVLLGVYMMHSFGECPREERESHLSQILEDSPHPKYCLSARACQGILNRANNRGKKLPNLLEKTLIKQSASKNEPGDRGGARESSYNTIEQGHCQHSTINQSCLNPWDVQSKHIQPENGKAEALYSGECRGGGGESYVMQGINGDKAATLDASYYKGCGERQGVEREVVCVEGNGSRPSHKGDGYRESDTMYTLNSVEQHAVCYSQDAYDKFTENEKSASLKACGGTYGGGSESIAIQKVTGSLMASGYQKLGTQEAMNGMYVVQKKSVHCAEVTTKE